MTLQTVFAVASSLVGIACFLPYIRDIFRHITKPHSYTWFIWSILQGIATAAMWSGGAGIAIIPTTIGSVLCGFIFLLSLRYGTKDIKLFDTICFVGALVAVVMYFFFHNPLLSVIFVSLTDFVGFLPTFRKTYINPESETASTHLLSSLSNGLALGALATFNIITSLYLVSITCMDLACGLLVIVRTKQLKAHIND
jgi:hypothetical protein